MSRLVLLLSTMAAAAAASAPMETTTLVTQSPGGFLYFAYGSNLLRERLRLRNPSATFVSVGRLKDHIILFGHWTNTFNGSNSWHGGVATIEESIGDEVWGVVWRLDAENLKSLDRQEGVGEGIYRSVEVNVSTDEGDILCRSYRMNNFTPYLTSPPYKQVVCLGAKQHGLPLDYIKKLEAVETNGYDGPSVLDKIKGINPSETNFTAN